MTQPIRKTAGKSDWFVHDRFGMFIHWGLYALGARHEWLMANERIPVEQYERYFKYFDPDLYDPNVWAQAGAAAGMKYFVVTSKHHEGFCLWDTKLTDYKSTRTPYGKDVLTPMVNAFRSKGIRAGLYYSLIDWHHPQFVLDPHIGPYRDHPDREKMNVGRDQMKYADYLHGQVRELIEQYHPDIMWFDFSYPRPDGKGKGHQDWRSQELYDMIRRLAPDMLIDDRLDLPEAWDFKTPEQAQPRKWVEVNGTRVAWEACQTFSGSWGYHRDEQSWRSTDELVRTLIDCVSKGGNLLLNVGPTGRGDFDERAMDRLSGIGKWMNRHSRSIYGCTEAPAAEFTCPQDCRFTYNPATRRLYVHIFAWPYKHLHIDGLAGKVEYAQLLNDASEVGMKLDDWHARQIGRSSDTLTLELPKQQPSVAVPVVELFLK
jgi:alpha-L-fucosidase